MGAFCLKEQYIDVQRIGGAGDRGIDIARIYRRPKAPGLLGQLSMQVVCAPKTPAN